MKDLYKVNVIKEAMEKAEAGEYYLVRLKGDDGKAVNLDKNALRLLIAYYSGNITETDVKKFYEGRGST